MQVNGFIGQADAAIDAKGRVSFPKELRQYLHEDNANKVVVTIGPEKSLMLYPLIQWNQFAEELSQRPRTPQNMQLRTLVMAHAKESTLDGQNRISLSPKQMEWAGISSTAVFVANSDTVRIFSTDRYNELYGTPPENFDDLFFDGAGAF